MRCVHPRRTTSITALSLTDAGAMTVHPLRVVVPQPDDHHPSAPALPVDDVRSSRVLIVDDSSFNIALLDRILRAWGFREIESTTDSTAVEGLVGTWDPDLLMLDLQMPAPDGFEIMRRLASSNAAPTVPMPILMLTADTSIETRRRALALGASDFLCKPFDASEVCLRAHNLLRTRRLELELATHNAELELFVTRRTAALERAHLDMLGHLARVAEYRDDDTHHHTERVGRIAMLVGARIGLDEQRVEILGRAAELHDIGKVAIPDSILHKPGKLTDDEFEIMKGHTVAGAEILAGSSSEYLEMAAVIALSHHERWDGGGYPAGISADEIPLESHIVMIADVFDALTHERPYKEAMSVPDALRLMREQTGSFFDPLLMAAFEGLCHRELV